MSLNPLEKASIGVYVSSIGVPLGTVCSILSNLNGNKKLIINYYKLLIDILTICQKHDIVVPVNEGRSIDALIEALECSIAKYEEHHVEE